MNLAYQKNRISLLSKNLQSKIFGQNDVIEQIVNTIKVNFVGLSDKNKPMGSFLFTGSTGVGKTELAIELARNLNMNFERFDMSEYSRAHSVTNLIGSAKGLQGHEEGGLLTNAISDNPHSVVLFDEIEKADKTIFNTFLQVLDYATLSNSQGEKVDFSKTIIIFTSNIGAENRTVGFTNQTNNANSQLRKYFSPEFLARLNSTLNFNNLNEKMMKSIIIKYLTELSSQLVTHEIHITYHKSLIEYLMQNGLYQNQGARGIKKIIDNNIKIELADAILNNRVVSNSVYICINNGEIFFKY